MHEFIDLLCFMAIHHIIDSHEIKRHLLPERKAMTNLDGILKSRYYFANKGPSSQSYGVFQGSYMDVRFGP